MRKLLLMFLLLLFAAGLLCQAEDYTKAYLLSYPQSILVAAEEPKHWDASDWHKVGAFCLIGGGLYLLDGEINGMVQRNKGDFTKGVAWTANQFGNGSYIVAGMAVTWAGGYFTENPKTQDTALLCLKSFLLANGVTTNLKYFTQRERPYRDRGKQFWNGGGFRLRRDSFPSGHATVVWSLAPILAEQYKETRWVPPTVYSIAALTCYARMHDEKHWASDVFTGSVIGYYTARLVLKSTPRLQVVPSVENKGISFNYNF